MHIHANKDRGNGSRAAANAVPDRGNGKGVGSPSVPQRAPEGMPIAHLQGKAAPQTSARLGVVQGMFGFEFELHVVLSQGMAPKESEFVATPMEHIQKKSGRKKVGTAKDKVVVGSTIYEWNEESKEEGGGAIHPEMVEKDEPGRWHKIGEFTGKETDEALYFDPLLKKEDKIFKATESHPVNVVEDHASTALDARLASIPEFVTEPRDEFDEKGAEYVLRPVVAAQELAQKIEEQTKNRKIRVPAKTVFPNARPDLYLGINDLGGTNDQKPTASVQATAAVELGQVPEFLRQSVNTKEISSDDRRILEGTLSSAGATLSELKLDEKDIPGIGALLHLIAQYLTGGAEGYPTSKVNVKNNAPFLIRPALTDLVGHILEKAPQKGMQLLEPTYVQKALIPKILEISKREAEEPVFKTYNPEDGVPPTTQAWLEGLFHSVKTSAKEEEGVDEPQDLIRDYSRFGRARKLPLEDVGPTEARKKGVPLEARQVNTPGTGATDVPIASWMVIAKQYYEMLRGLNSPKEEVIGEKLGGLKIGTSVTVGLSGKLNGTIEGLGKEGHYAVRLAIGLKEFPFNMVKKI